MGDLLLKQKPARISHWQSLEMLSRRPILPPYPPKSARLRQLGNFRPPEYVDFRDYNPYAIPYNAGINYQNKPRDYCYLTPYYRSAMPPPPISNNDRLLMVDPSRRLSNVRIPEFSSCRCKSKSMDDVRQDIQISDWEEDENGNHIANHKKNIDNRILNKQRPNRRSMDNLLIDTGYGAPRRIGSLQVNRLLY